MPELRVVTYNVRYFGHGTRGLSSQERMLRRVARSLVALEGGAPDLIALQEIETFSLRAGRGRLRGRGVVLPQIQRFVDAFHSELSLSGDGSQYRWFYFPAHTYRLSNNTNIYTTGLAILVRPPLQIVQHNSDMPFDITDRPRRKLLSNLKQTRIVGHVSIRNPRTDTDIDLFNTHLSLPSFFTRQFLSLRGPNLGHGENQLREVARLVDYIEAVRNPKNHLLLVGDFNSRPGSPVYEYLTEERGLTDAFGSFHQMERHAHDFPTAGAVGLQMPLDYVFSCGQVKWVDFDGTHPFGLTQGHFHGLSDHVPLVGRASFEPISLAAQPLDKRWKQGLAAVV